MQPRVILNSTQFQITIDRLCRQLVEGHNDFSDSVIIGLQPRGINLANRISQQLKNVLGLDVTCGSLDATFFRDDFRRHDNPLIPNSTKIDFLIEHKKVILVDDVLFTGRTIRAGMDALMAFGRPESVELLVLIDRRYSRHLPIQPDYTGRTVDSVASERVKVDWQDTEGEDKVVLYTPTTENE